MKAAKFYGMKDIRVEEAELPVLKNGMVKVKIAFAGICGSDLHEYVGGAYGRSCGSGTTYPMWKMCQL